MWRKPSRTWFRIPPASRHRSQHNGGMLRR
jgi:hypothetical protein